MTIHQIESPEDIESIRLMQILVGEPTGGAERFFVKLALAMRERGVTQKLAIKRDQFRAEELLDAGCDVEQFDFGKGLSDWLARLRLQQCANRFAPTFALAWMNRAARRIPKGSFVKTGRIGGYYKAKNYRRCDWIIANSPDLERFIVADGWRSDRVQMISNFGEMATKTPVAKLSLGTPEDAPVLLALGRLHPSKGFDLLIRAAVAIPPAHVWIAGSGETESELRALAQELGVAERVHFLGWRDDQGSLLSSCDVCVVPSRHEPLSNVTVEAWSMGVPVVACASEGPSWLIEHAETGWLCGLDDADSLTAGLKEVLGNQELRTKIAAGGQQKWRAKFSKNAIVDQYIQFILAAQTQTQGPQS